MTVYSKYGIFEGGVITKSGARELNISSYKLHLYRDEVTSIGNNESGIAKKIEINFGAAETSGTPNYQDMEAPDYYLNIAQVGVAYYAFIYYSDAVEVKDIVLQVSTSSVRPSSPAILIGQIYIPANTTSIDDLVIVTSGTNRDESLVIRSSNPESSVHNYYDGQDFTHGQYNVPLTNLQVLAEVLEAQSLLTFSSEYFVTMCTLANIIATGTTGNNTAVVRITPCKHYHRSSSGVFSVFNTKENSTYSPSGTAYRKDFANFAAVANQTIYIYVDKDSGEPGIDTSYNSSTKHLIAYASVGSITDLANLSWNIVNTIAGQGALVETVASLIKAERVAGFLRSVEVEEVNSDNKIKFNRNFVQIDGYIAEVIDQEISLSAAPSTGARQDFIYIELKKQLQPWTILDFTFKVVSNINFTEYSDPFLEPSKVLNSQGNSYSYTADGYYKAVDNTESSGFTYALPIMVIHRFNQNAYSAGTNDNGGSSRPDGYLFNRINLNNVEIQAPVSVLIDNEEVLSTALNFALSGDLNKRLQPTASASTVWSRKPLQIDRLGTNTSVAGTTFIGKRDGVRNFWSNNRNKEAIMYLLFKPNQDGGTSPYDFPTYTYDSSLKALSLKVPSGTAGEIITQSETGQPIDLEAFWVNTGAPVVFATNWSVEQSEYENRVITNYLDTTDSSYEDLWEDSDIAVTFKIRYTDESRTGFTKPPSEILYVAYNGDYITQANHFAPGIDTYNSPTFIRNLEGSGTGDEEESPKAINSVEYSDSLFLERVGNVKKYHSYELRMILPGNGPGMNTYTIPAQVEYSDWTLDLVGLHDVRNKITGERINVNSLKWTDSPGSEFQIILAEAVASTIPVEFIFAVGGDLGKQLDANVGSCEPANLAITNTFSVVANHSTSPNGKYMFSDGSVFFGVSSSQDYHGVYVEENFIRCNIRFISRNLLEIELSKDSLTGLDSNDWQLVGDSYVPKTGVNIRVPTLVTLRQDPPSDIYIMYKYNSLPWARFLPAESDRDYNHAQAEHNLPYPSNKYPKVIKRGYLILTKDGIANERGSIYSPVSERFPVVDNIQIIGSDSETSHLGLNDILSYGQLTKAFLEGSRIIFDKSLGLSTHVDGEMGIVLWACLVKQLHAIRLFIYQKRSGDFILDKPENAFVCELEQNYRVR